MATTRRTFNGKDIPFDSVYPLRDDKCCRRCGEPLTGRRTAWCSDSCSFEASLDIAIRRGRSQSIRYALRRRDDEVCAGCGVDTKKLRRILHHARTALNDLSSGWYYTQRCQIEALTGYSVWGHLWEADHIIEVANGGQHLLENLQTLCIVCHKAKTRRFVSKR